MFVTSAWLDNMNVTFTPYAAAGLARVSFTVQANMENSLLVSLDGMAGPGGDPVFAGILKVVVEGSCGVPVLGIPGCPEDGIVVFDTSHNMP